MENNTVEQAVLHIGTIYAETEFHPLPTFSVEDLKHFVDGLDASQDVVIKLFPNGKFALATA